MKEHSNLLMIRKLHIDWETIHNRLGEKGNGCLDHDITIILKPTFLIGNVLKLFLENKTMYWIVKMFFLDWQKWFLPNRHNEIIQLKCIKTTYTSLITIFLSSCYRSNVKFLHFYFTLYAVCILLLRCPMKHFGSLWYLYKNSDTLCISQAPKNLFFKFTFLIKKIEHKIHELSSIEWMILQCSCSTDRFVIELLFKPHFVLLYHIWHMSFSVMALKKGCKVRQQEFLSLQRESIKKIWFFPPTSSHVAVNESV